MALQNSDGNYLKITSVDLRRDTVFYSVYRDSDARQNKSEFDAPQSLSCNVRSTLPDECASFTTTGDLKEDVTAAGYRALKNEPPFNGASGETWTDC